MTAKLALKNDAYKKFIQGQVLRPFQSCIFKGMDFPVRFNRKIYKSIPELIKENPEWADMVFDRMAKIYESVDASLFPEGKSRDVLLQNMSEKGIIIT